MSVHEKVMFELLVSVVSVHEKELFGLSFLVVYFHFELCHFILSCVFRMVTVRKVTKRSINTQVHCYSEL